MRRKAEVDVDGFQRSLKEEFEKVGKKWFQAHIFGAYDTNGLIHLRRSQMFLIAAIYTGRHAY